MNWDLQDGSDDFTVPSYQEALDALCAEDWCNWGSTKLEKVGSLNKRSRCITSNMEELGTDRQRHYFQVYEGTSRSQGGGSSSTEHGEPSSVDCSTRLLEASPSGQPDSQLQHSMDWMDDAFLNSLLEEDPRNMENSLESLNMTNSVYGSLSSENPLNDMLIGPQSLMNDSATRETSISTGTFPFFTNDVSETWGRTNDSQSSCLMPEKHNRSEGSNTDPDFNVLIPTEPSAWNENEAVADIEPNCLEATVLQELEGIMIHLNDRTRVCFRDALYRLATNSKEQHIINQKRCVEVINGASFMEDNDRCPSTGREEHAESKTNVIDRTVANLMFNKPCYVSPNPPSCTGPPCSSMKIHESLGSYYYTEHPVQAHYYQGGPT